MPVAWTLWLLVALKTLHTCVALSAPQLPTISENTRPSKHVPRLHKEPPNHERSGHQRYGHLVAHGRHKVAHGRQKVAHGRHKVAKERRVLPANRYMLFKRTGKVCMTKVNRGNDSCLFISPLSCDSTTDENHTASGAPYQHCMRRRATCALVGSSVHLLDAEFGEEIDEHDMVIRMNTATSGTQGSSLARKVGSKTTTRFVNGLGQYPRSDVKERVCHFHHELAMEPKACGRLCWRQPFMCRKGCNFTKDLSCKPRSEIKANAAAYQPVILDQVDAYLAEAIIGENSPRKYTTAGFKAFAFALRTCSNLTIYGFGPSCNGDVGARYYQSEEGQPRLRHIWTDYHFYDEEFEVMRNVSGLNQESPARLIQFKQWVRTKAITMRLPKCLTTQTRMQFTKRPSWSGLQETQTVQLL